MAENFDLQNIVTPVKVNALIKALKEANYDANKIKYLEKGFTQGFDIGYKGPQNRRNTAKNIPLRVGNKVELWNKLMKEVKAKRVAGPFKEVPFENFIQFLIGLVPKAGSTDQTRLIFHLSYDFGEEEQSLNHHTPEEICTVKYNDIDCNRAMLASKKARCTIQQNR